MSNCKKMICALACMAVIEVATGATTVTASRTYVDTKVSASASALTNYVDSTASGISSAMLTTNDVCNIVTNCESSWEFITTGYTGDTSNFRVEIMEDISGKIILVFDGNTNIASSQYTGQTYIDFGGSWAYGPNAKLAIRYVTRNALGLARVSDLPALTNGLARLSDLPPLTNGLSGAIASRTTTNDVCNIVTNEVAYGIKCLSAVDIDYAEDRSVSIPISNITSIVYVNNGVSIWDDTTRTNYWKVIYYSELQQNTLTCYDPHHGEDSLYIYASPVDVMDYGIEVTIQPITQNALGLARLVDLPPLTNGLPTMADIPSTNGAVFFSPDKQGNKTALTVGRRKGTGQVVYESQEAYGLESKEYVISNGVSSLVAGTDAVALDHNSVSFGTNTAAIARFAMAQGSSTIASGPSSHAEGLATVASASHAHSQGRETYANGRGSQTSGFRAVAGTSTGAHHDYAYTWNGNDGTNNSPPFYYSHGSGTYNINPVGGASGFYIGNTNFATYTVLILQSAYDAAKAYADSKEYSRLYVVTNAAIDGTGTTITNEMGELITGMAFDLYYTNSLYFLNSDNIPTFKFFAPHRRHVYLGNDFSCVEIGDNRQFLKTCNVQVDGAMAIQDPSHIRFMSTLDRNSPYDQGTAMTMQDYLDAFNPVLVPQVISLYQTNRADFSVGSIMAHGEMGVEYPESSPYRNNLLLFHVSDTNFNYKDIITIKPRYDLIIEPLTNSYGQVTNHYNYVKANANIRVIGLWDIAGDMAVTGLSIKDKLYLPGFDDVVMAGYYTVWDTNGNMRIEKGVPNYMNNTGPGTSSRQATFQDYMDVITEPFIAATNKYQQGDIVKEVHSLKPVETGSGTVSQSEGATIQGNMNSRELLLRTNNRTIYHYSGSAVDSSSFNANSAGTVSNLVVKFSRPYGYTNETSHLEVRLVVDMSTCAHRLNINIGRENFSNLGSGLWDTILSTTEPDIRTEQVVHTETTVQYDWIYDETIGDWVEDTENPQVETYEWYDEYQTDMTFVVEPYACKEFYFKQVGDKTMRVEIIPLYKTNPTSN